MDNKISHIENVNVSYTSFESVSHTIRMHLVKYENALKDKGKAINLNFKKI